MKKLTKAGLALLAAGVLAAPVSAATWNITFTGEIESFNDGVNTPLGSIGTLDLGDAVTGGFTLDTSVVGGGGTTQEVYSNAVSNFAMVFDGLGFSHAGTADWTVRDDHMAGSSAPLRDSVRTRGTSVSGPTVGGLMPALIQFALGGTNTSVLSDTSMPTIPELNSLLATDNIAGNLNFLSFADGSEARFRVDSISIAPVPLPAAAPMLVAGLAGFAALRRRKARKAA